MMKQLIKIVVFGVAVIIVVMTGRANAGVGSLSVAVPKTAYIDWLAASGDAVTSVDGGNAYTIDPYVGGAVTQLTQPADKAMYVAVMCNALAGYDLTLTASNAGATASTANLTLGGAADITYTAVLTKEAATFTGGATAATSLDLTGATKSGTSVFAAEADLPLLDTAPNVWKLTLSFPAIGTIADDLITSGTYTGGVTTTIALK